MSPIVQVLPLLMILALYAAYLKLAARILRVSRVGWLPVLLFAAVVLVVTGVARLAAMYFGELPLLLGSIFGLALHMALGAWFFRERALAADGQPLGWGGGAKLTAVALGLLLLTSAILAGVLSAVRSLVA